MTLTTQQLTTLRNAINAETDATFVGYRTNGQTTLMAEWLNQAASPAHLVWRTECPVSDLLDAIAFDQFTPNGAADGTATYTNRVLLVQTKQMNLQNMLIGRDRLNCSRSRVRGGLLDAVTNLPTGASGALVSAAGVNGVRVTNAMTRQASRVERLFATVSQQTGDTTAFVLTFEGSITADHVVAALSA